MKTPYYLLFLPTLLAAAAPPPAPSTTVPRVGYFRRTWKGNFRCLKLERPDRAHRPRDFKFRLDDCPSGDNAWALMVWGWAVYPPPPKPAPDPTASKSAKRRSKGG